MSKFTQKGEWDMSDVLKRVLCLVLALVVVFSFSACRHSPVLEQKVYTADGEVDPNNQQTDNDEEHSEEDSTLPPRTTKPSQKQQADQTKVSATKPNTDPQTRPNTNSNGQNSQKSTQAPSNNTNSNTNKGTGEVPGVSVDPNSPAQAVDRKAVNRADVPEDVATVVAAGDAALYVEMLGGADRLLGSSNSFKESYYAQKFADYSKVDVFWEKKGDAPMGEAQFRNLLAKDPEAVFYTAYIDEDGNSQANMNVDQITRLNQQGIYTIPLALFNTTANIKNNVKVIGKVLGKGSKVPGAKNANNMANDYINWMDSIVDGKESQTYSGADKFNLDQDGTLTEKNNRYSDVGKHTILINGWDDNASTELAGQGVAYARTGYSWRTSPVSYYLSIGGAANNAVLETDGGIIRDLPVVPFLNPTVYGNVNGGSIGTDYKQKSDHMTSRGGHIGTDPFKTIIVDSNFTKQRMQENDAWRFWGVNTTPDGLTSGYGMLYGDSIALSNIHGEYDIVVNPYGIGSWTEGSPESPLEVLWAEQIFLNGQDADAAFGAIREEVRGFYQDFYGVPLTDADLDAIRNGI